MVEIFSTQDSAASNPSELLSAGELVAVVDDSPEVVLLLSHYLNAQGLNVVHAGNAKELQTLLSKHKIALLLLDIGLPDKNGDEVLRDVVPSNPDLGIIMVTGTIDIEVALECLRLGADDYLTKPVTLNQFNHTVINTLQKRRLMINSKAYQKELQITNTRMRFLHHLNLKMNTAYLNTFELNSVLQAILIGITADDGLRFNRAFLALYNTTQDVLEGRVAIGPSTQEKAGEIWHSLKEQGLQLDRILETITENPIPEDIEVNLTVRQLSVQAADYEHVLIQSIQRRKPIFVQHGIAPNCKVPDELIEKLQESSFVVVPLYSPSQDFGVIIVDNHITKKQISYSKINDLEIFASQASIAIEHSHLYEEMANKIAALEMVTSELEKNRDLLINAERESTIGRMSSQLLHTIRNPLTSIGGTSRLLSRKTKDPYLNKFLKIITEETIKIERTLDDLFTYVIDTKVNLHPHPIYSLVRKIMMVFYTTLKDQSIEYILSLESPGPVVPLDENKIRQLFLHLIRNSIEAMPTGGTLNIDGKVTEDSISISIQDSGSGIAGENLRHVADPFFSTKTKGNGMGLALVEQIIKAHSGTFQIDSKLSEGTVVTVNLPRSISKSRENRSC
ncbi:MAG: response regulator [Desulfobulbaceae bacterium]|nr:response regulator [Desulfobulbaceae bacterium]